MEEQSETLEWAGTLEQAGTLEHKWKMPGMRVYYGTSIAGQFTQ
jgi:hypothetical protein